LIYYLLFSTKIIFEGKFMGRKSRILISILSVFMVCLLANMATTTLATGDWGNLEAGDEMRWKHYMNPMSDPDHVLYQNVEILDISGTDVTIKYEGTYVDPPSSFTTSNTYTTKESFNFAYSQSYLQKLAADAEANPDWAWTTTEHEWNGKDYKTYYWKRTWGSIIYEHWYDQDTGITFEATMTYGGTTYLVLELLSTTANLTEAGIIAGYCLGTLLIALVSVTTLISYSLVRNQKKKRT